MSEPLRIGVNGALGRMGAMSCELIEAAPDLTLAARTDVSDDLPAEIASSGVEVVLDFTHHSSAMNIFASIVSAGAVPVSGTSGFSAADVDEARRLADSGPGGMIIPNFSLGAVLMMKFAREAAAYYAHSEIIEIHHDRKADAPSGTAEITARMIGDSRGEAPPAQVVETERYAGARGARISNVPVHSVRLPGALAHQEVLLSGAGEILTIRHDSLTRESFHAGILLALRRAPETTGLVYGLEALL